ncbi:MAG: Rpn family recombination-promoting nuclease/putative transposase [Magnetococcus sp. YQC-5]
MKFLNPKTDFAFKKIFGSEESGDVLISLLNAILLLKPPHLITSVRILDPYLAPKIKGMKDTYLDVRVNDQSGRDYIIEMQVLNVPGFEKRILYNTCKAYANQLQKGDRYDLLTNVVAVTITDFIMYEELVGQINRFVLRAFENPDITIDDLALVFAELPKFHKQEDQLESIVDKWFYFMKHAGELTMVPKVLEMEPAIKHAFDLANKAALTPEELDDQERREMFIQDQRGVAIFAERKGFQDGEQKGRQNGRQEGEAEMLLKQMRRKFGQTSDWVTEKVKTASLDLLGTWGENVLFANSVEEVFADRQ